MNHRLHLYNYYWLQWLWKVILPFRCSLLWCNYIYTQSTIIKFTVKVKFQCYTFRKRQSLIYSKHFWAGNFKWSKSELSSKIRWFKILCWVDPSMPRDTCSTCCGARWLFSRISKHCVIIFNCYGFLVGCKMLMSFLMVKNWYTSCRRKSKTSKEWISPTLLHHALPNHLFLFWKI